MTIETSPVPIRVLLVDDHRSVLWGLAKLIDSAGGNLLTVATADSGESAAQMVAQHSPDVVLMDLDLGAGVQAGIDNIAVLAGAQRARIIALTGSRDPHVQERAVRAGARGFVHKSEPAEIILKAVERVHAGELWLDRATMARLVNSLSQAPTRVADPADSLTPTERRVIAEVVRHKSLPNKVIADSLSISTHTLRNHLASIYGKLSLHRRLDLVLFAIERKLA